MGFNYSFLDLSILKSIRKLSWELLVIFASVHTLVLS